MHFRIVVFLQWFGREPTDARSSSCEIVAALAVLGRKTGFRAVSGGMSGGGK
jgi:hypothetical protein